MEMTSGIARRAGCAKGEARVHSGTTRAAALSRSGRLQFGQRRGFSPLASGTWKDFRHAGQVQANVCSTLLRPNKRPSTVVVRWLVRVGVMRNAESSMPSMAMSCTVIGFPVASLISCRSQLRLPVPLAIRQISPSGLVIGIVGYWMPLMVEYHTPPV